MKKKRTDFQKAQDIRNFAMNCFGEIICYDRKINLKSSISDVLVKWEKSEVDNYREIDPSGFTVSQVKQLGFLLWSEKSKLWLFPLWLFPFLNKDIPYKTIGGDYCKIGKDNDSRFGALAYGIEIIKK